MSGPLICRFQKGRGMVDIPEDKDERALKCVEM